MEETFAPRGLLAPERLRALATRSDALGLKQLAAHLSALAATAAAVAWLRGSAWIVPATVLYGVVMIFLFTAQHECIHRTVFRRRRLNDAVAWACGLVVALPPRYFRYFHFAHHRHTQDPGRDPELATPRPRTVGQYILWITGLPYWSERLNTIWRSALGHTPASFIPKRAAPEIASEARFYLAVYIILGSAAAAIDPWAPIIYWIAPALAGQTALRLFLLNEHIGCPYQADMLANSRTTKTNALVRRISWNMPYHMEHHLYPGVPFHALPALHADVCACARTTAPGYTKYHAGFLKKLLRARG